MPLGQQYEEIKDAQGNITGYKKTNNYSAGMGAPYSSGNAGQIVTPEMQQTAFEFQRGITPSKDPREDTYQSYNDMIAGRAARLQAAPPPPAPSGGSGGGSGGASSSSSYSGMPIGSAVSLPTWGGLFLQDQLARIRDQSSQERDVAMDELSAAGLGTVGGAHIANAGEIQKQQLVAERGAAADNERLAQEYALRAAALQQQALDRQMEASARASQENAARYGSLADAAGRLKGGDGGGGAPGETTGSASPLTGNVWGAKITGQQSAPPGSAPLPTGTPPRYLSDSDLANFMVDNNKRNAAGYTYNQLLAEKQRRQTAATQAALAERSKQTKAAAGAYTPQEEALYDQQTAYANKQWTYVPPSSGGPGWRNSTTGQWHAGSKHPNA